MGGSLQLGFLDLLDTVLGKRDTVAPGSSVASRPTSAMPPWIPAAARPPFSVVPAPATAIRPPPKQPPRPAPPLAARPRRLEPASEVVLIEHVGEKLAVLFERNPRARRASLRVDARTGRVRLVAPPRMARETALAFARSQAEWIHRRVTRLPGRVAFEDGAVVPYFGVDHRVRASVATRGVVRIEDGDIRVASPAGHQARRLRDWLAHRLGEHVMPLARAKAAIVERRVGRVSIRDTATQWGSCTSAGALSFCWRLVFAPPEVVDYVVAHEIAHLVHANHGPRFWALTATLTDADVAASRAWLRDHGARLMRYG